MYRLLAMCRGYFEVTIYSKYPLIRINWEDGEPSRYAENQDNWIFL